MKEDLEDKEKEDLKRIYDSWKKQDQVRTRLKKILKTFKALNCLNSSNSQHIQTCPNMSIPYTNL